MVDAAPAAGVGVEEPAAEGSTPAAAKSGAKGSASASSLRATFTPTADESAHVQKAVREAFASTGGPPAPALHSSPASASKS